MLNIFLAFMFLTGQSDMQDFNSGFENGPLYVWRDRPTGGVYLSAPEHVGDGRVRTWVFDVTSNASWPDRVWGLHNEYDCTDQTFSRIESVKMDGGEVVEQSHFSKYFRQPSLFEMEFDELLEICSGRVVARPTVQTLAVARELARRNSE